MDDSEGIYKRRHKRTEFTYAIEFKILSRDTERYSFSGYIENVSDSGAGIVFEDRYGRAHMHDIKGSKIKLSIVMPDGEKVTLISTARWVRKDAHRPFFIQIGIEFENIEQWQMEEVKKLVLVEKKDHSMMWNLWEQYERNS
jgi:c-di-GMP-binding flagellar brake protein YcgR